MVTAAVNDNAYNIVLLLHLLSVIVGTGAAFLAPALLSREQKVSKLGSSPMSSLLGNVMSPALLLGGVFGGALVGMSDDVYDFGQTWLAIGGGLWLLAVGSAALAFPPSFITLPDVTGKRALLYGVLHISLAVMLILMVWFGKNQYYWSLGGGLLELELHLDTIDYLHTVVLKHIQ